MTTVFADIVKLLDTLANGNGVAAPHAAFWDGITRADFIAIQTDQWGAPGPLVKPGSPNASNLYLALAGIGPFGGAGIPRMPDVNSAPTSRYATDGELKIVHDWITAGAP